MRVAKNKIEDTGMEKEELSEKLNSLENKLICLQQELNKRVIRYLYKIQIIFKTITQCVPIFLNQGS